MQKKLKPLSSKTMFRSNFLTADESNLNVLLSKIQSLHSCLSDKSSVSARRPIKRFLYKDVVDDDFFCEAGSNSKKLAKELKWLFDGTIKWHSPFAAFNITPPPLLDTVAASTIATLMNPNCLWDMACGKFVLAEKKIIKLFGNRILKSNKADGLSTFGGKGTLMYAIKTGLGNCDIEHKNFGLHDDYVVVCSYVSHFCIADVCDYVGVGSKNLLRVPLLPSREIDYSKLESTLENAILSGKKIATVICNGGITLDFCVDNAKKIRKITDALEKKYDLPYKIHLHGDLSFGWAWLFSNVSMLKAQNDSAAKKILKIKRLLVNMKYTDSIGVDFHKMGFCPFNSSFFILKNSKKMNLLGGAVTAFDDGLYGSNHPHYHSLENSKSGAGIISAYATLYLLGSNGITELLLYLLRVKEMYVHLISEHFQHIFTVQNTDSLGFEVVFSVSVDGVAFEKDDYINLCNNIWYREKSPYLISQVLRYFKNGKANPALLIYSMSPHVTKEHCVKMLKLLENDCKRIATYKKKKLGTNENPFVPR